MEKKCTCTCVINCIKELISFIVGLNFIFVDFIEV